MKRSVIFIAFSFCTLHATASVHGADPVTSLARFSEFPHIDLKRLQAGEILSQRGTLMNFPNGVSAQFCYIVSTAPAETARRLQTWDPTRCKPLKVALFHTMKSPCDLKDFAGLHLDPRQNTVKKLVDKTLATTATTSELNLTHSEANALATCIKKGPAPDTISSCWASLLCGRATDFQKKGFAGTPPYEFGEQSPSPASQIGSMVGEQGRIVREFAPVLRGAGLIKDGTASKALAPTYNWSLFDADHHATLNLGAVYELAVDDRYQLLDVDYYVSNTYYAAATLYEIWPIRIGEKTASLVWRGDFYAAPMLRFTKGIERIAYGAVMIQEIKKGIRCFQDGI